MKKIFLTLMMSGLVLLLAMQVKAQRSWSAGIRGGIITSLNSTPQALNPATNWSTNGMALLFVQRSIGKQQRWMIEMAGAYYTAGRTSEKYLVYAPGTSELFREETRHAFNLQVSGRYKVFTCDRMNWKHYAGIFFDFTQHAVYSEMKTEIGQSSTTVFTPDLMYYTGLSYFGKFDLSNRLNAQYQLGYGHELPFFYNLRMGDAPYSQKLFFNLGIGYSF